MNRAIYAGIYALGWVVAGIANAFGSDNAVLDCDRLAPQSDDPQRTAPGVSFLHGEASSAVAACRNAVGQNAAPRLKFQYALSLMSNGTGSEAIIWFRRAADMGYAKAMVFLGATYMHDVGEWGVTQNIAEAIHWLEMAANKGDVDAMTTLGKMYRDGRGVAQNGAEAVRWLEMAANKGDAETMNTLGEMYKHGQGVPVNYSLAAYWYDKAAPKGIPNAMANLGWMWLTGRGHQGKTTHWHSAGYNRPPTRGMQLVCHI